MLRISMTYPPRDLEKLGSLAVVFAKDLFIDQVVEGPEFIRFNVENTKRLDLQLESWIRVIRHDAKSGSITIEKVDDDYTRDPRRGAEADAGGPAG